MSARARALGNVAFLADFVPDGGFTSPGDRHEFFIGRIHPRMRTREPRGADLGLPGGGGLVAGSSLGSSTIPSDRGDFLAQKNGHRAPGGGFSPIPR